MKSIVLWSAGQDSTYLILDRLRHGFNVQPVYVEVTNNRTKVAAEKAALTKLHERLKSEYGSALEPCAHIAEIGFNSISLNLTVRQPLLWLISAAYYADPAIHSEVTIGYILSDEANSYAEDMQSLWKSLGGFTEGGLPPLTFPLKKIHKSVIKQGLPSDILDMCIWCENPTDDGIPCGEDCQKCVAYKGSEPESMVVTDSDYKPTNWSSV